MRRGAEGVEIVGPKRGGAWRGGREECGGAWRWWKGCADGEIVGGKWRSVWLVGDV